MSQAHRSQTPGASTKSSMTRQPARDVLLEEQQKSRIEIKRWRKEYKEKDEELQTCKARNKVLRERLSESRMKELSLRQTNQLFIDIIKGYADRETSVIANVRTLWRTHQPAPDNHPVRITEEDLFD